MKDLFRQRSAQNLRAAELLAEAGLFDAAANRSYYAVFDAAFVACLHFGLTVEPDHAKVLSAFCRELVSRRKIFPAHLKKMLYDVQTVRIQADYGSPSVSRQTAKTSIKTAQTILSTILEKV
jgi:uncharacterized protein (UPF0332 family)